MILNKLRELFRSHYLIGASSVYIFASFLIKGIHFLTTPIFTRIMPLQEYGNVSSAITLTSFFAIFICCQVAASINTAKVDFTRDRFNTYMYNLSIYSIGSAFAIGCVLLVFGKFITGFMELRTIFIVPVVISAFSSCMVALYSTYLVALKQPKKKANFSIVYSLFVVGLSLGAVILCNSGKDLARVSAIALAELITAVYIFFNIKRQNNSNFEKSLFRQDVKYALFISLPLIPHLFANLINSQADRVFIVRMLGADSLAFYSVAYSLGMAFLAFTDACLMAWTPWYYEKTRSGGHDSSINKVSSIIFIILSLLFSTMILLAPEALRIVAPPSYAPARTCVIAVAFGVFFQTLYRFPIGFETCMKNTKYTAVCTIITAVVNIGLNFLLIPKYGIFGAAIATAISYIVLFLTHDYVARHIIGNFNIPIRNYIFPICIVSGASIFAFICLNMLVVRLIALAVLLFLGILIIRRIKNEK